MKSFIEHIKNTTKTHGIKLSLVNQPSVIINRFPCSGYFLGGQAPELAVAIGKDEKEWNEILVHEFSHMNQWIENDKVWRNLDVPEKKTTQLELFDLWLGNDIELNKEQLRSCISSIIDLELDCEKRAIKMIKEFKLDINIDQYIKKANSYLLFYHVVKNKRCWSKPGKAPYTIAKIVDSMPNKFDLDYANPPTQLLGIIEKNCLRF